MKKTLLISCVMAMASAANAAVIQFDLFGKAGAGLLSGNENHVINGIAGSGGEVLGGISFDDATNLLTLNFGFGSANGFGDLTGNASAAHIHGPTASGGSASYTQNAGVKYGLNTLPGWNPSATGGGMTGVTVAINPGDVAALLDGRFYINVHTPANGSGEIRGNLVPIPEPAGAVLGMVAGGVLLLRRRRA
jgi:hypothetical protein